MAVTKALIVEDEILIAEDLRITLERLGHQVVAIAASGNEAIRKADELHPDLVLMDVRLQGAMNGIETARRIKSRMNVPVIYVTAYASVLGSLELDESFASLAKPFSPAQLQAAISTVLGNAR